MPLTEKTKRRWLLSVLESVSDLIQTQAFPSHTHEPVLAQRVSKATAMRLKASLANSRAGH